MYDPADHPRFFSTAGLRHPRGTGGTEGVLRKPLPSGLFQHRRPQTPPRHGRHGGSADKAPAIRAFSAPCGTLPKMTDISAPSPPPWRSTARHWSSTEAESRPDVIYGP